MAKNEKTSPRIAAIAAKGLRTGNLTKREVKSVSATALTQAPDRSKDKSKK